MIVARNQLAKAAQGKDDASDIADGDDGVRIGTEHSLEDRRRPNWGTSSILGKSYKPKTRHKMPPTLPDIKQNQSQVRDEYTAWITNQNKLYFTLLIYEFTHINPHALYKLGIKNTFDIQRYPILAISNNKYNFKYNISREWHVYTQKNESHLK